MKRANKQKKRGKYRRRSRIQIICQAIIGACAIFILGCVGYMLYYTLRPLPETDAELSEEIDRIAEYYKDQDIAGCEDTYDKVKACYTYLIENCSYSTTVKYTYEQDAYLLLTEKRGSCTYYAAAFHYMMRYIGLDDKLISSYRILESGGSFHRWNEIAIDGIPYVFDTQWEDTLSMGRKIQYVRFFKTYQELEGLYVVK